MSMWCENVETEKQSGIAARDSKPAPKRGPGALILSATEEAKLLFSRL